MYPATGSEHSGLDTFFERLGIHDDIIDKFRDELWNDGDDDPLFEFCFGFNADRIEWDDQDFSHMEFAPSNLIHLDFTRLGDDRFNALTPLGVHWILFNGPHRRIIRRSFERVLELEQHRVATGNQNGPHSALIVKHLKLIRKAMLLSVQSKDF